MMIISDKILKVLITNNQYSYYCNLGLKFKAQSMLHNSSEYQIAMLRPGQTLALAGPEARHYNHPATPPPPSVRPPAANVYIGCNSAIS